MNLNPSYVTWTRNQIEMLSIGGKWGLPRSGTIVTRLPDQRVKIEGPEASNEELRSYIEAAGYTIDGQHPREAAFDLFDRFESEAGKQVTAAVDSLLRLAERYETEAGCSDPELRSCLGVIIGLEMMDQGMCLFHNCLGVDHANAHDRLYNALVDVYSLSPEATKSPEAAAIIDAMKKRF